jgi:hypothetical protein
MTADPHDTLLEIAWRDPPLPAEKVSAAIREACTRDLRPRRGLAAGSRALLSLLLGAGVIAFLVLTARGPGGPGRDAALAGAAGWGVVLSAVLIAVLGKPPGRRGSRHIRLALALGLPLVFFLYLAAVASEILPFARFLHEGAAHAFTCGSISLGFGALAAGAILYVWRHTDPISPGLTGALSGLCGGLASAVGIGVACTSHEGWHLWLAHGTTVLAFVLLGWVAGRRWLPP